MTLGFMAAAPPVDAKVEVGADPWLVDVPLDPTIVVLNVVTGTFVSPPAVLVVPVAVKVLVTSTGPDVVDTGAAEVADVEVVLA